MIEERVNLIIEYIEQILSYENRVLGKMEIDTFEKDGEKYLNIFDIIKIDERETVRFDHKKNYLVFIAKKYQK